MAVFQAAELLIPREDLLADWAVIACDQFTSQPEYWREVREQVGDKPSAYHIIFPEAELGKDEQARTASINDHMRRYLGGDVFRRFPDAYVYVERRLFDGSVRRGVVGMIDLEDYDYQNDAASAVRATRPFLYEAKFMPQSGTAAVKQMFATGVFKPDDGFWTGKGETMTVCLDQLPPAPFRIEVCAISSLEAKSRPLTGRFKG